MSKFGISQPVKRVEDPRLLRGEGRYIEDLAREGMLRAVFVRSPVAHARIATLETAEAEAAPGVHLVLTGAMLEAQISNDMTANRIPNRDGTMSVRPKRPWIAVDRVRYVGEAVALVVAETLAEAKDAAELIEIDYDTQDCVIETAVMGPEAPLVHEDAPDNLCYDWSIGDEAATEAALASSTHRVELDLINNKVIANAMETRGCLTEWDGERMHVHFNGQGPWGLKDEIALRFDLPKEKVATYHPDVGGGFGTKSFKYPEYLACAQATRLLGRPVKWISDRGEGMLSDVMGRDNVTSMVMGFDAAHRITAMKVEGISNLGAYCSDAGVYIASDLAARVLTGVYDIKTAFFAMKGVFTHTVPVDAYRGAGRPEAQYALERLMDKCARVLGTDPLELRRKNFIQPEQFPYDTVTGEKYDVGDFNRVLDRALEEADYAGFPARRAASAAGGKLRGLGVCYYIESILGAPDEIAKIEFAGDGAVNLYVGTQSNGQGHETVFTQFLHGRTGIPFDKIRVVQGDSDRIAKGGGTGGSRSVTTQGTAIHGASDDLIAKMKVLAEEELEVAGDDLVWGDGAWRVAGTDRSADLMTLAARARATGRPEFLVQQTETVIPGRSYPNGCHIAEMEIDPETGKSVCVKYTVVDDFGILMNPVLAEGQVHGGVAQGIGQAITEHVVFDTDGQLLSGSFMDYAMPRADDIPWVPFHHEGVPSVHNAIGMKGCGEAGTVGACAAVVNAGLDALWDAGVTQVDMPLTPERVWSWLQGAKQAAE